MDCGFSLEPPRRGGSNEYSQPMFLSRNKKKNVYICKLQFYCMKVGFKGVKIIKACFRNVRPRGVSRMIFEGFNLIELPYLLYVFGHTDCSK